MKVRRLGITEVLRRIWLFSANKIKTSESFSKKSTWLKLELNSSLWQKLDTNVVFTGSRDQDRITLKLAMCCSTIKPNFSSRIFSNFQSRILNIRISNINTIVLANQIVLTKTTTRCTYSKYIYIRCLMVSTNRADPSCFYFRISWILMERRWFYFFVPSTCCRASEASKIDYFKN